ncbi:MAG: DUF2892 domain-containing protein [Alphaproteobacteria bacterium]|nr:DUF2892 domain-containing protein [Alphaproteobacteria bacterium]
MTANVGNLDRIARILLGAALIALPFLTEFTLWDMPAARVGVPIVGAVLVLTAGLRFCPMYRLLGINTCRI